MDSIVSSQEIKDQLKNRILQSLIDLIPEDKLDQMVDDTMKKFEEEELPKMIMELCKKHYSEKFNEKINELVESSWDMDKQRHVYKNLEKIVVENAPQMFAEIMSLGFQNLQYKLQQGTFQ